MVIPKLLLSCQDNVKSFILSCRTVLCNGFVIGIILDSIQVVRVVNRRKSAEFHLGVVDAILFWVSHSALEYYQVDLRWWSIRFFQLN